VVFRGNSFKIKILSRYLFYISYNDIKERIHVVVVLIIMLPSNFIRDLLYDGNLNPLVKPDIVFGKYFFKWDEKSLGLYSDEI